MSPVVNAVLTFLAEQYEVIVYVAVAAVLLFVAQLLVRRIGQQEESEDSGLVPKPQLPAYDEEKHRLQIFVNELRAHNRELKSRITRLTNQNSVLAPLIKEL
ncbi:MAG: hypothetical protein ACYTDY_20000, partial [Planctomycetota bacterium]